MGRRMKNCGAWLGPVLHSCIQYLMPRCRHTLPPPMHLSLPVLTTSALRQSRPWPPAHPLSPTKPVAHWTTLFRGKPVFSLKNSVYNRSPEHYPALTLPPLT